MGKNIAEELLNKYKEPILKYQEELRMLEAEREANRRKMEEIIADCQTNINKHKELESRQRKAFTRAFICLAYGYAIAKVIIMVTK